MKVIYSDQELPTQVERTIFLAGPTPREKNTPSWRPYALECLKSLGYDGHVFVPEPSDGAVYPDYNHQVASEQKALKRADCVLFWIPCDLDKMPGFTTNVEFGASISKGNVVLGYPLDAPKMRYLNTCAENLNIPIAYSVMDICIEATKIADAALPRVDGEVCVPGYIWENPGFQRWYQQMRAAGNRLDYTEVDWVFRIPNGMVFSFALKVHVYVASENRVKTNEYILTRSDIGAAFLYYCPGSMEECEVVLVREFRSPARTSTGQVLELPSGSSLVDKNMYEVAIDELGEETTIKIDRKRFAFHPPRQLAATLSTHKSWLVSAELTCEEMDIIKAAEGKLIQGETETEKTYVKVVKLEDLLSLKDPSNEVDYATLGMILAGFKGGSH